MATKKQAAAEAAATKNTEMGATAPAPGSSTDTEQASGAAALPVGEQTESPGDLNNPSLEKEPMAAIPSAAPTLDSEIIVDGAVVLPVDAGTSSGGPADTDVEKLATDANTEVDQAVLLQMRRDAPIHDNGPTTADVHPDEVMNMLAAGWQLNIVKEHPLND